MAAEPSRAETSRCGSAENSCALTGVQSGRETGESGDGSPGTKEMDGGIIENSDVFDWSRTAQT